MRKKLSILLLLLGLGALYLRLAARPALSVVDHPYLAAKPPLVIAHRGGRGLWPENTLYTFQRAAELGVDVLEMDVRASADGALVVLHDPTVDRTTEGEGPVNEKTLGEFRARPTRP